MSTCASWGAASESGTARWECSLGLFKSMQRSQAVADAIAYGTILSNFERGSQSARVPMLLLEMKDRGIKMGVTVYNAAICAYGKGKQWRESLALLIGLRVQSEQPDMITQSALVSAVARGGRWESVLRGLDDIVTVPGLMLQEAAISYSAGILACTENRRWDVGLELLESATRMSIQPDAFSYGWLSTECEQRGLVGQGAALLQMLVS